MREREKEYSVNMYFRNKFTRLYRTLFSSIIDVKLKCVCDLSEMLV